jgi:hypothetical protein
LDFAKFKFQVPVSSEDVSAARATVLPPQARAIATRSVLRIFLVVTPF